MGTAHAKFEASSLNFASAYDEFVPDELLRKAFVADHLDVEEMQANLQSAAVPRDRLRSSREALLRRDALTCPGEFGTLLADN